MNDKVKSMVKNVVEENVVGFKQATSQALYQKIGNRLQDHYKTVSKELFKKKITEAISIENSIMQGTQATPPAGTQGGPEGPPAPEHQWVSPPSPGLPKNPDPDKKYKDSRGREWIWTVGKDGTYRWLPVPKPPKIRPQNPNRGPSRGPGQTAP